VYLHEGQRLEDECDREELIKKGHRSTLLKAFRREHVPVAARGPRKKPQRTPEHKAERNRVAKRFATKPSRDYVKELDLSIDNKTFGDNDPTGYKSGKAQTRKRSKGIVAHVFPREVVWSRLVWVCAWVGPRVSPVRKDVWTGLGRLVFGGARRVCVSIWQGSCREGRCTSRRRRTIPFCEPV
jgi:hypothetical protein